MAAVVDPGRRHTEVGALTQRYLGVRDLTERLAAPLSAEDQTVQSMPDTSPTKWHRAHTTWFFETFVLTPHLSGYAPVDPAFAYLFNSYYEQAGARYPRPQRGLVTRPGIEAVAAYRRHVDAAVATLIGQGVSAEVAGLIELGLNHEQQHQELLLMDIKHVLSFNPLCPAYAAAPTRQPGSIAADEWLWFGGGLVDLGHAGEGFAYDNESPRHKAWVAPFRLGSRLVTCGAWLEFIADGGYTTPTLWLSDGWAAVREQGWRAPLYWLGGEGDWSLFTLAGEREIDPREPVCHVSYYEADAFARWAGARLPTEAEWEVAAAAAPVTGNFVDSGALHPLPARNGSGLQQMFGDLWEWTMSPYAPYPGFRAPPGAVGEYNGKFMVNQMVLRGGCCATSRDHVRATYRNFFYPHQRWAFSGVRLAVEAS
ncbi:MAG: ergothioneine biosynthesis protein EgtB [Alphaproteobacteria bacterium]